MAGAAPRPGLRLEAAIDFQCRLNLENSILALPHAHAALAANPGDAAAVLIANRPAFSSGPGAAVTTAMRAGLVSLVDGVADGGKPLGIRVNAVAPSIMDTTENRRTMREADSALCLTTHQVVEVTVFLIFEAESIVTGAVLPVFGRA